MADDAGRAQFFEALACRDHVTAARLLASGEGWFSTASPAQLQTAWQHILDARVEVDEKLAQVEHMLRTLKEETDKLNGMSADIQTLRTAVAEGTDDLDVFQAGYERGYAQGWAHGQQHEKAEADA